MEKSKAQGFETTDYGVEDTTKKAATIAAIVQYYQQSNPTFGINVSFQNSGLLTMKYHAYEMLLNDPIRLRSIQQDADYRVDEFVKSLKKEFKARTGKNLTMDEKKDSRQVSTSKVSLNERYYYVYVRLYSFE